MTKALPAQPNLAWLKKSAKERLEELRVADPSARLHRAQLAVANDYGFKSWRALKAHVDAHAGAAGVDGRLAAAASRGDAETLARLLDAHPDKLGVTGGRWNTPLLHLAAEGGQVYCIDLLLARGIDVNLRDTLDNATALHWAAAQGRLAAVKRLIERGADIDGEGDAHEMNVIGWATSFQDVHPEVAEFLLARGAEPTLFSAVALRRADLVRRLVEADPRILDRRQSRFEQRRTALHVAVRANLPDMVALLLELGADPKVRDDRGNTALNYATPKTDPRIAASVIAAGADPAEQSANRFESAVPILSVRNVPAAIAWYESRLGFRKEWDWGAPPTFACVVRDSVRIFLCQGGQGAPGTWISVFVHDVDALYEEYRRRGATVRQPPANFPWGLREMNVEDLDGHRLRLGSDATGPPDNVPLGGTP